MKMKEKMKTERKMNKKRARYKADRGDANK